MTGTPSAMLDAYVRAFETLHGEHVVPFYELPCTFIRPDGTWVVQDDATALVLANHLIEHAKGQGYHRTEVSGLVTRELAPGLAELTGLFVRFDASEAEIARFGFTYIVRAGAGRWRIVVAAAHEARGEADTVEPAVAVRHCLATLAYRGGKALRGAPPSFAAFSPGPDSRTPSGILAHLCDLLDWSTSLVRGAEVWQDSSPGAWDSDVRRFFQALDALDDEIAALSPTACSWSRLVQGPIADALTHVGQLAMLRRLAGSAVRGENYFKAEIVSGRVGPDQSAPRREFD